MKLLWQHYVKQSPHYSPPRDILAREIFYTNELAPSSFTPRVRLPRVLLAEMCFSRSASPEFEAELVFQRGESHVPLKAAVQKAT